MRCKNCNYTLWNLPPGPCPECGTPFKPSDFEFVASAVQYRCPHCQQSYYGTSPTGHLVPRTFACVSCARPVDMDEMVLLPTQGLKDEHTKLHEMPWLERKRVGFFKGFFRTIGQSLVTPGRLMQATPLTAPLGQAVLFAISVLLLQCVIAGVGMVAIMLFTFFVARAGGGGGGPPMFVLPMTIIGIALVGLLVGIVWINVHALSVHVLLRITGPCQAGLGRTLTALYYSTGANTVSLVPCIGSYFGWIWWVVSAVLMVRTAQGVSAVRAVVSVLALPAVVLVCVASFMIFAYFRASQNTSTFSVTGGPVPTNAFHTNASIIGSSLVASQVAHGQWPTHASELILDSYFDESQFVGVDFNDNKIASSTVRDARLPDGTSLAQFGVLRSFELKEAAVQRAIDAMPRAPICHRLGDYVFTYHGLPTDLASTDPLQSELWAAIVWPDPAIAPAAAPAQFEVVWLSGRSQALPASAFDLRLAKQNELRAKLKLPPLPHPRTVRHEAPVGAPDAPPTP